MTTLWTVLLWIAATSSILISFAAYQQGRAEMMPSLRRAANFWAFAALLAAGWFAYFALKVSGS